MLATLSPLLGVRNLLMPKNRLKTALEVSLTYLRALVDFSFTQYITIQMLPVVYGLMIVASGVTTVQLVISAFDISNIRGWAYLVLSPFAFIVLISICRALLEFLVIVFRIAEDIDKLAGMRESVDKISGIADLSSIASRIPFVRLLQPSRRRDPDDNTE
jgi:hypothetical protein